METYRIIRFYAQNPTRNRTIVATGKTLEEAQAHCNDPETSSSTCTGAEAKRMTAEYGPWFEGYESERPIAHWPGEREKNLLRLVAAVARWERM